MRSIRDYDCHGFLTDTLLRRDQLLLRVRLFPSFWAGPSFMSLTRGRSFVRVLLDLFLLGRDGRLVSLLLTQAAYLLQEPDTVRLGLFDPQQLPFGSSKRARQCWLRRSEPPGRPPVHLTHITPSEKVPRPGVFGLQAQLSAPPSFFGIFSSQFRYPRLPCRVACLSLRSAGVFYQLFQGTPSFFIPYDPLFSWWPGNPHPPS